MTDGMGTYFFGSSSSIYHSSQYDLKFLVYRDENLFANSSLRFSRKFQFKIFSDMSLRWDFGFWASKESLFSNFLFENIFEEFFNDASIEFH